MADQGKSEQEPSIEEILASIRQIISDDEQAAPVPEAANAPAVAEPKPAPAPQIEPDVIELVDRVEEEVTPPPVQARPEPVPAPPPPAPPAPKQEPVYAAPEPEPEPEDYDTETDDLEVAMNNISARMKTNDSGESVFSEQAQNIATGAFSELVSRTTVDRTSNVTLEDIAREMMRPMLRAWIDKHVPKIVERLLQQELERISKRVLDE